MAKPAGKAARCDNNHNFYYFGKYSNGYQKHLCRMCGHQYVLDRPEGIGKTDGRTGAITRPVL